MRSAVRMLVLWLVTVALPFHGMVMAAMLPAAGGHHAQVQVDASPTAGVHAGHAGHAPIDATHAGMPSHHDGHAHGHGADSCDGASAAHTAVGDCAAGDEHDHGALDCCSAGCAAAAVSSARVSTSARTSSAAPLQPPSGLHPDVVLDGLERPPKPVLV